MPLFGCPQGLNDKNTHILANEHMLGLQFAHKREELSISEYGKSTVDVARLIQHSKEVVVVVVVV